MARDVLAISWFSPTLWFFMQNVHTYKSQVFVQIMCKQRERKKKEWMKKKKSRMAESLETDRVNLIKFYDLDAKIHTK